MRGKWRTSKTMPSTASSRAQSSMNSSCVRSPRSIAWENALLAHASFIGVKRFARLRKGPSLVKIALGADHAGYLYKDQIAKMLQSQGHEILDFGACDATPVDYPQYGYVVGEAVATGQADRGIVVCGSSIGIAIAANKVPGIRACPVTEPYSAELARRHNDCNVIAFSERLTGWEMIERMLDIDRK